MVLAKMKEIAETYLGCTINNAVITVPAYFNDSQRQATKNAGAIAGFNVMRIIDEPTAAAISFGKIIEKTEGKHVLIFNLGGGTCDVSLLSIRNKNFVVRATAGDTHLGGKDFDDRLVDHCIQEFKKKYNKDITGNARSLRRLKTECERAKRTLSISALETIEVSYLYDGIDFSTRISRARFEELNIDLFTRCMELVGKCLSIAKIDKEMVDVVVLVGGSTRIPKVQQLLHDFFEGKKLYKRINPDEVVASGAAIEAVNLNGQSNNEVQNLVLVDVSPLYLDIDGGTGGRMEIVVPRNTPIPTKKQYVLTTIVDDQTSGKIPIYEGERAETKYNNLLGMFVLDGIDCAPKGIPRIDVYIDINADGILNVSAQDRLSGHKNEIVISKHNGDLTPEEIQKMVEEAACYKVDDKDHKARVSLEDFANKVKAMAKDPGLSAPEKKSMEEAADNVISWLDRNHYTNIDDIHKQQRELEITIRRLMKLKRGGIPYDHVLFMSLGVE
ncbi:Heat shock 70 kDa protein [Rhynchospora pubera]|nr:Heat shock 70 kDa protein [Rhynchospora pubera]